MMLPSLSELPPERPLTFCSNVSWGIRDPERFNELMEEAMTLVAPGYYLGDNLFTWNRNISFMEDERFYDAWRHNARNTSDIAIVWRRYILACAGHHCLHLPGDFVECGVYAATGIKTVVDYLGGAAFPKKFYGYDTFDYNPVKGHAFEGQEAGFHEEIKERFLGYDQVVLIKGLIPDSFAEGVPEKIAYLHIDLNNAEGEIAALEHLFDRVVAGGMIILDDYEWAGVYRPQKMAEDAWFEQRGYKVFPLPTGQGFLVKR